MAWNQTSAGFMRLVEVTSIVFLGAFVSTRTLESTIAAPPLVLHADQGRLIDDLPEELPPFSAYTNLSEQVDWVHDWTFLTWQRGVGWVDHLFIDESSGELDVPEEISRFSLGIFGKYRDENGAEWTVEPDLRVSVHLPNLERRFTLFLTTEALDELLETDPTERDRDLRLGASRAFGWLTPSMGVKISTSPELFVKFSLSHTFVWGHYYLTPSQGLYWESGDGFGEVTSLLADRWVDRVLLRSASSTRWTEQTTGLEWEQSLVFGYAWRLLSDIRRGHFSGPKNMALGTGLRGSVFGQVSSSAVLDRYRLNWFVKFPIWRPYLFGILSPELQFRNSNDWEEEWGLKFGFEFSFYDTALEF